MSPTLPSGSERRRRASRPAAGLALALLTAALAAGCGDSVYEPEPPPAETEVPASALASVPAYTRFTGSLPADDRAQPLHLGDWQAPTSETAEPEPLS